MNTVQRIKSRLTEVRDWTSIVDQLEAEANASSDKATHSKALFELARANEEFMLDKARAMTGYQAAFKADMSNLLALEHARRIYWHMASHDMVAKLMGLELKNNQDPSRVGRLNYSYGLTLLHQRNVDAAGPFFRAALEAEPDNTEAQRRLVEVSYDRAQWPDALQAIYGEITEATGAASPLQANVAGRGAAVSSLYLRAARIVHVEQAGDEAAAKLLVGLLLRALDAEPSNDEAAYLGETAMVLAGQQHNLPKLMDRRAANTPDLDTRLQLLRQCAEVWQIRLNDTATAASYWRQALELAYDNGLAATWHLSAFHHLALEVQKGAQQYDLVSLARKGIAAYAGSLDAALIGVIAGEYAWKTLQQEDVARELLGGAYDVCANHPAIQEFEAQVGPLTVGGTAQAAITEVESSEGNDAAAADHGAAERAAHNQAAAEEAAAEQAAAEQAAAEQAAAERAAAEQQRAAADEAAAAERAVAEQDAAAQAAAQAAAREEAQAVAAASKEAAATAAAAKERAAAEAAAAAAAALASGDPVTYGDETYAPQEWAIVLQAEEAAKKGPKQALDAWRDAFAKLPAERSYARDKLKALYIEQSKWSNVADVYKDAVKRVETEAAREPLLWELVELYRDKLKQPGLVVTTLAQLEKTCEAIGDNSALLRVVETQQSQYEEMKRWPDLIARLRRRAELTEDIAGRVKLHLEAGTLFLDKFNNQAEAIKSYESVLEEDDMNAEAIEKLKDLYGRRRDWDKMIVVEQKSLLLIEDPRARQEALLEIARTAGQRIKKPSVSIELWAAVLAADGTNAEALEHLEGLYEKEKAWAELAHVLETLVQTDPDTGKHATALAKLGALYSEKLEDNNASIRAWERLIAIDAENRRAQDNLRKLYLAVGDMDALQEFYAKQDKWGEFVRVLEREVESAEGDARTNLFLKIASLYKTQLDKADRAMRALEKALEFDAANLAVAERLIELYEEAGDERNLATPLEIKLAKTEDSVERQQLLVRLADLADRIAGDASKSFSWWLQAFEEDNANVQAADALRRLAQGTNRWREVVESFTKASEGMGATRDSIPLRLTVAEVYEKRLTDLDQALKSNQAILDIDAEESTALASLERLYLALGREEDLLAVLNTKLSLAGSDDEKRQIQTRIGSIHEQLKNFDAAISNYRAVLDSGFEDSSVLTALDRIYAAQEQWTALAEVLRRQLDLIHGDDFDTRTSLLHRLAIVSQERLDDAATAIDLYRQVLAVDDGHEDARVRLESWLGDAEHSLAVAVILQPVYESRSDWPALVRTLEIQTVADDDAGSRVARLLRTGAILGQAMQDTKAAFDAYARAFAEDAENEVAQSALSDLAGLDDRWVDLAKLYEDAVGKDLDTSLLKQLLAALAGIYQSRLGNVDQAIATWNRAVDLDPADTEPLDALQELHTGSQNWAALLETFRKKVALEHDPAGREELRFRIARLQEELLEQPLDAVATYNEILADDDANARAIAALDRLYAAQENWTALGEILDRQRALQNDPAQRISVSLRLGEVRLARLDQKAFAVDIYREVLSLDPHNATAIAALETLLADEQQSLQVARLLEPIYRANNDWSQLIQALEIMGSRSLDPSERTSLLHQIAELHEIAGERPEEAFQAMGRALRVDPTSVETQRRLDHLAAQIGAWAGLVDLYESVLAEIVDESLAISILEKIARIQDSTLEAPAKAAEAYERILASDPANFAAIDALIDLHRRTSDFSRLVVAVCRRAEMVEDPDQRKELLNYAANVKETVMEDREGAVELYRQALAIDDTDVRTLDSLERIYIQLENWESLKDVYTRKTELTTDPDDRRKILGVLGSVYDTHLKDIERSIDTYQAILEIDPFDYDAIGALDRLYGQAERWVDQLQILEQAIKSVEVDEERTTLRYRVAALWEGQLGDTVRAVEAYRDVLTHEPGHAPTVQALERIAHGEVEPMTAAAVLEPYYEQLAEWEKLIDLYEVIVRHTEDPIDRIARLHQIAAAYERYLQQYDKAFEAYARALDVDPQSDETIEHMFRLAEVTSEWERYAQVLAAQAEKVLDPMIKTGMLKRTAAVELDRLANVESAVARYQTVLELDSEDAESIHALDRIFTHLEKWPELVVNLQRQTRIAQDDATSLALQFRMGQTYQLNMHDLPSAIAAYRDILAIDPTHGPTQGALELIFAEGEHQSEIAEILEPIYFAGERWESLVKLGEVKLSATEDTEARLAIIRTVADICERRLSEVGDAYLWWLRAYMDDPQNTSVAEEVERLAEVTMEWGAIVDVGEQVLEGGVSPEAQLAILSRSARILDTRLADWDRAVTAHRRVLTLDAENAESLEALDRILTQSAAYQDLAEVLQRRVRIEVDSEAQTELELRLADVYERHLQLPERAVAAYNRALDNDPSNRTALERLEGLYAAQFQWEPLFSVYQRLSDIAATDEDMADCFQRMAKIASDCLSREADSVELWQKVLDLRGENGLALSELAALHERAARWDDLVEVLERLVYALEDVEARIVAYQTLGRTYGEKLGKERNAVDAWLSALELNATNLVTLEALRQIYESSQAWVELIDILTRLVALGPDILGWERLRDLHARMGTVQADYLMQPEDAVAAWTRVVEIDGQNLEALAALERLYSGQEMWEQAISVLERKGQVLTDNDGKIDVLMQVASIWEDRLNDLVQASGAYQELLELDPTHGPAAEALDAIYRKTDEWGPLTELLINRTEYTDDPLMKVAFLQQVAVVFEEKLDDLDGAFTVLQTAFNIDYANEDTARELERIATLANRWQELLNEYNEIVEQIQEPSERCELLVKIGRWYGEHLNRADMGITALNNALGLNPESVSALRELSNFHRRAGDATSLTQTLTRIVPLESDPEIQASTLLDLANVQEAGMGDAPSAIESYRRVLEIDSENPTALDALARLHEGLGHWNDLVTVLTRRVQTMDDPDAALYLRKRVGWVQEAQLTDPAAAVETYRDILASEPTDRDALTALERLYMNGGQMQEYLETLEAQLDATADVNEQIIIYEKMAQALIERLNDRDRAAEVLEKILLIEPTRGVTYEQLEQLYFGLEKWGELVDTYRKHVDDGVTAVSAKTDLLKAMAEVFELKVEDVDRAIDAYREIMALDSSHFEAANRLSQLQERIEDWPGAVETMGRLVELHPDPAARVELLTRLGRVYVEKLEDQDDGERRLNEALLLDPAYVPALAALAELYKSRYDWLKASKTLRNASGCAANVLDKTKYAADAAFIHLERLDDRPAAVELFAHVMELDPEHVAVGRQLADLYYEDRRLDLAEPIFDMLARKAEHVGYDDEQLRELFVRAATVSRSKGSNEKALKYFKRANDLDSTNLEVLSGLADLYYQLQDWEKAFKSYQTILVQHRDTQSDDATVLVYHRLGVIKRMQGEGRKALNYFEKALEVDPHHEDTLRAVIELHAANNDWEGVILAKRALTEVADGDAQFALLQEIGALYVDKLANHKKAAEAYNAALDLQPQHFPLLHTLLDLYQKAKQWEDAIRTIDRITEIETDPIRRSRYNYAAAALLRDQLKAHDEAIDRLNMVLDDDPSYLKAFQSIDEMVTRTKDWKTLERSYRKMLKRLPADGEDGLKLALWKNLGEIYRTRLQNYQSAAAAFEFVARFDPGDPQWHVILAELYGNLLKENPSEFVEQAVREHQILIANEPFRTDSYNALYDIYANSGQTDKAYCVGMALGFLKRSTDAQKELVAKHKPETFVKPRNRLSEEVLRKHVTHPDQDPYLTGIMGLVAPAIAMRQATDVPASFKPQDRLDINADQTAFSQITRYIRDVLNVQSPDVYLRPQDPGDVAVLNLKRDGKVTPSVVVMQNMLRGKREPHLAFGMGRHLMDLYLPHYAYVALGRSPQNLKQIFYACMRLCDLPVPGDQASIDGLALEIKRLMAGGVVDNVRTLMKRFIENEGSTDVKRWSNAVELTSYRVGLLMCGDLDVAALMISQEPAQLGSLLGPKDKIKELVLYSISEDYFQARRALGLQVG